MVNAVEVMGIGPMLEYVHAIHLLVSFAGLGAEAAAVVGASVRHVSQHLKEVVLRRRRATRLSNTFIDFHLCLSLVIL